MKEWYTCKDSEVQVSRDFQKPTSLTKNDNALFIEGW